MQSWNRMAVALGAALLVQAGVQAYGSVKDSEAPIDSVTLAALEDAAHEDRLEPLALELAGLGEPRFELSLGSTATRRGFALDIAGGGPTAGRWSASRKPRKTRAARPVRPPAKSCGSTRRAPPGSFAATGAVVGRCVRSC